MRRDAGPAPAMVDDAGSFPFVEVQGTGVYEIPVGPVHAGLIEPGHFRFSVVGETILKMKARLWFVHKGIERLFEGRDIDGGVELAEKISGDTAVGHWLAYCLADRRGVRHRGAATGVRAAVAPSRVRAALQPCGRRRCHVQRRRLRSCQAKALTLRERLLRLNGSVTGHRLLRGGVRCVGARRVRSLPRRGELTEIREQFHELVDLALGQSTVMDRFTGRPFSTPRISPQLGVLGVVARASGSLRRPEGPPDRRDLRETSSGAGDRRRCPGSFPGAGGGGRRLHRRLVTTSALDAGPTACVRP